MFACDCVGLKCSSLALQHELTSMCSPGTFSATPRQHAHPGGASVAMTCCISCKEHGCTWSHAAKAQLFWKLNAKSVTSRAQKFSIQCKLAGPNLPTTHKKNLPSMPTTTVADRLANGCGSKLNRRVTQVLVHVSTYQGSILVPAF